MLLTLLRRWIGKVHTAITHFQLSVACKDFFNIFWKFWPRCYLMSYEDSNLEPHDTVLPVFKRLNLNFCLTSVLLTEWIDGYGYIETVIQIYRNSIKNIDVRNWPSVPEIPHNPSWHVIRFKNNESNIRSYKIAQILTLHN